MKLSEGHTRKIGGFEEAPQVSASVEREYTAWSSSSTRSSSAA